MGEPHGLRGDWSVTDEPANGRFVWRGKGPRDARGNRRVVERAFGYTGLRELAAPIAAWREAILKMDAELCRGPRPYRAKPFRPGRKRVRLALHV